MHRPAPSLTPLARVLPIALALLLALALPAAAQEPGADQTGADQTSADQTGADQPAPAADTAAARAAALVDVLRDEEAREALIAELERLATPEVTAGEGATDAAADTAAGNEAGAPAAEDPPSVSRRIAEMTRDAAQAAAASAQGLWRQLERAPDTLAALGGADLGALGAALHDLALTIVSTYAVFLILRAAARLLWGAMSRAAARSGFWRTLLLVIGSSGIDVLVVVAAWAAGYVIAIAAFGEFGSIALLQTLYLNAFLAVELSKVVLRALIAPASGDLRLMPLSDAAARYLDRRLKLVIGLLGYGQILVVPVVNQEAGWATGRAAGVLVALLAIAVLAVMVLSRRRPVARWLSGDGGRGDVWEGDGEASGAPEGEANEEANGEANGEDIDRRAGTLPFLARNWHWPALGYLLALALIVLARPGDVLFPVLGASGQILLAALVGFLAATWLKRAIERGVHLPRSVNERLPLLERRLNAFVPKMLLIFRLLVIAAVIVFAFHTVGLIDARAWMDSQLGVTLSGRIIGVLLIVLFGFAVWLAMSSWVDWRLNPDYGRAPTAREETLLALLKNAATIAILAITAMFALSEIGLDIGPLLASAGVLGLAIGFGAQKMVQDIITGIFIQFENAINVGDVVTAGGTTGVVERLTIRSVSLRDLQGTYHIIPFSSVDMVSNFMRGFAYHVCDMGVAYREDVEEVRQAMQDAYQELRGDPDHGPAIMGDLEWFGLNSFGDSAVMLRARIKTLPGKQWGIGRAYNGILKRLFDERGIEIPFPHQTIYFGEDKRGKAPPMRVALEREGEAGPEAPAAEGHASGGTTGPPSDAPPASDEGEAPER